MNKIFPNKNSMFYWWPLIEDLPIPKPKTILVKHEGAFKGKLSYAPFRGEPDPYFDKLVEEVKKAAKEIGYPVFIRSDQTSAKFEWKNTCYVESEEQIRRNILNILEFTAMTFTLSFFGIAVREFLELDWRFTSHKGMPVAAERRYFVKDGKVICWHPYWPPASIRNPSIDNWLEVLKELQTPTEGEVELLTHYAELIGERLGGYWSIDFCRHKNGTWYLTDMALGKDSYHWATCPNAPPEMLQMYGDPEDITEVLEWSRRMKELEERFKKGSV